MIFLCLTKYPAVPGNLFSKSSASSVAFRQSFFRIRRERRITWQSGKANCLYSPPDKPAEEPYGKISRIHCKKFRNIFCAKRTEPLGQSSGSNSVRFFPQVAVQKLPEGTYPHQLPGGMCAILGSQVFLDERKKHMKEKACFCSFDVLS